MQEESQILRESVAELRAVLEEFTAGKREQLFDSRDALRDLSDQIADSAWFYLTPVCETITRSIGFVLRHGGLTEPDAIELATDLIQFVGEMLEQPVPGMSQGMLVKNKQSLSPSPPEQDYVPKSEPIKINLGMVDETRLGEILVRLEFISSEELTRALALQQVCRKRLGQVLISQGLIDDQNLNRALQEQRMVTLRMATNIAGRGGLEIKLSNE